MNAQRGNALFLILIAVALFAALSYAVTRTGSGQGTISREDRLLAFSELDQYNEQLAAAISRLTLINGCALVQIGFTNDVWKRVDGTIFFPPGHNPNTPGPECELFMPEGGGLVARTLPSQLPVIIAPGGAAPGIPFITTFSILGVGSAESELVIIWRTSPETCEAFNQRDNLIGVPVDTVTFSLWSGSFSTTVTLGDDAPDLVGRSVFGFGTPSDAATACRIAYTLAQR